MSQKNIINLLSGASKVAKESGNILKKSSANFIEEAVIKGNYVSREEHEQLKQLVLSLQKEISELKSNK